MLILGGAPAIRSAMSCPISLSMPILVCGMLLAFGAFVGLVLVALRSRENVQAGLQIKPWSITISIRARNGGRKCEPASKGDKSASKP